MKFADVVLPYGLFLAPMAGYTDRSMRAVCRAFGAEYTVTEMVSSRALCYHDAKTPALARLSAEELPAAVQLFGSDPGCMAEAAAMIAAGVTGGALPTAIDVNMGCPVRKIVTGGDGSALMKDPDLICRIVRAVRDATPLPVTVKIRAGWDEEHKNAAEAAKAAEAGGASLITVHGRTRTQMYAGAVDLGPIAAVKAAVSVPVVGNGDIRSAADALLMREKTGCDGWMIGRGAVGNPFLFAEIRAALSGEVYTPPTVEERVQTALDQVRRTVADKGEHTGVQECRKQFAEYLHGIRGAAALRAKIHTATSLAEIESFAEDFLTRAEG